MKRMKRSLFLVTTGAGTLALVSSLPSYGGYEPSPGVVEAPKLDELDILSNENEETLFDLLEGEEDKGQEDEEDKIQVIEIRPGPPPRSTHLTYRDSESGAGGSGGYPDVYGRWCPYPDMPCPYDEVDESLLEQEYDLDGAWYQTGEDFLVIFVPTVDSKQAD
ncbi:MAG: hypothetical protein H6662_15475 [Ardenticatenaceae bacterium]|nr:hypothetical protein [Anaerolineales bacterium]MCB8922987.1 hypothetical protein [Ardenticatenaceae bacterium]MCB8990280.1 hypothetical protein [Ardenticatenaceae bacterium]